MGMVSYKRERYESGWSKCERKGEKSPCVMQIVTSPMSFASVLMSTCHATEIYISVFENDSMYIICTNGLCQLNTSFYSRPHIILSIFIVNHHPPQQDLGLRAAPERTWV